MAGPTAEEEAILKRLMEEDAREREIKDFVARGRNAPRSERGYDGARHDSRLVRNGAANAELTLIVRIFFQRVDPTPQGGSKNSAKDGNGTEYKLEPISEQELTAFRKEAIRQANAVWRGLCLVTPNDYAGLDSGTVRPNVDCRLRCEIATGLADSHVTVQVVAPSYPTNFISATSTAGGIWDMHDIGVHTKHVAQDEGKWFLFINYNREDVHQLMVPHEVGHLLGLDHIGVTLTSSHNRAGKCMYQTEQCSAEEAAGRQYGSHKAYPMWVGRDIMGGGDVVHACNALPWMHAMRQHTHVRADDWIPAGVSIPPRALKDVPKAKYTLKNSPYQGGFQEKDRY